MAATPFRPTVTGLEDRLTPAVSPTDVFAAVNQVESAEATLRTFSSQLGEPRGAYAQLFAVAALPQLAAQSAQARAVLTEFRGDLYARIAADPAGQSALLGPFVAATQTLEARAAIADGFATLFAQGFQTSLTGQPPVTPTPPDPGTPDPTTPDPGTTDPDPTTSDPTQAPLSTTIPDLNDPNWRTTASGLRILDVTTGTGDTVQPGDTVTVDYVGFLTDGTVFDSSVSRGEPSTFSLNQVIEGWMEGIPGMRVGGVRRLDIPADLAYGNNPPPGSGIPPGADLVFEIRMVGIN